MTKSLDDIMAERGNAPSAEPAIEAKTETPPPEQTAPETPPSDGEPSPEVTTDSGGTVPQAALHAERQKVKRYTEQVAAMEARMAEMDKAWQSRFDMLTQTFAQRPPQPAPEPPAPVDWYADPDAALNQRVEPIRAETQAMREEFSRMLAAEKFGEETVSTAYQAMASALRSNPQSRFDYQRIMASPHPYAALVDWHRSQSALSEIGPDPKAYREKLRAELLAEIRSQGVTPPPALSPSSTPSNFATSRSAAPQGGPNWTGPQSLSQIMGR